MQEMRQSSDPQGDGARFIFRSGVALMAEKSLDAQLAEALGWTQREGGWVHPDSPHDRHFHPPAYSTDGNAMLELLAYIREQPLKARAVFSRELNHDAHTSERDWWNINPQAVATAALAALQGEKDA